MDFHSLPRRELQALCKKNSIPANMTNVAMAEALQALHASEGIEFSSPMKAELKSPPKTGRRTSTRLLARPAPPPPQGSPMPRSRRVSAKAPGILRFDEGDEGEKEVVEEEKATVTTRRRARASLKKGSENAGASVGRRSTRGKANVKKMADLAKEEEEKEVAEAPSDVSAVDDQKFSVADAIDQVANEVEEVGEVDVESVETPKNEEKRGEVGRSSGETAGDLLPRMRTLSISVEALEDVSIGEAISDNNNLVNDNAAKEPEEVIAFVEAMKESEEANNVDCVDGIVNDDVSEEPEENLSFEAMKESEEANNVDCEDDIVNVNASKESEEDLAFEAMKESEEANNVDCEDDIVNVDASKESEVLAFEAMKESEEANNVDCEDDIVNVGASKESEVLAFEGMKESEKANNVDYVDDIVNDDASNESEEVPAFEAMKECKEANNVDCVDDFANDDVSKKPEEVVAFEAMKECEEANNVDCVDDVVINDDVSKESEEVVAFKVMEESEEANIVDCNDGIFNDGASKEPEEEVICTDDLTLAIAKESEDDNIISNERIITSLQTNNVTNDKENVGEEEKRLSMMRLGKAELGNMSLRKLRALYKDVKIKEGEEKRPALRVLALDENCLSSI